MNISEIESALDLHQKAFGYLLACRASGHAGSAPFDENTVAAWQTPDRCVQWMVRYYDQLPAAYRPAREQITEFAHLLSSLFATSFSVSKEMRDGKARMQVRALPSRRLDGSRKSDQAKTRERKAAELLRQNALNVLALELDYDLQPGEGSALCKDLAIADDLTLWTYAVQLVNRTHFGSQGPAIYHLWLALPEKIRRNLSAELIWRARQRIVQRLNFLRETPIS